MSSSLTVEYIERGFTRPERGDRWSSHAGNVPTDLTFATTKQGRTLVLVAAKADVSATIRVTVPEGSRVPEYVSRTDQVSYVLPPPVALGHRVQADMDLDAREEIMSCVAKSYANPKNQRLWVARSLFRNRGACLLRDHRVRFRLADYSPWSAWSRSSVVVPGQTVVDAFFPLMDQGKVAALTGPVTVALEMEYEYRKPDGELVKDSDTRQVQLLARNQVIFSGLRSDQVVGWHDRFNNSPIILSSFVSYNDPVVQQLAGWINVRAGGPAASSTDRDAMRFLGALFDYLGESRIAYQTPPAGLMEGKPGQHIKYARDVLRNHAGTCIDLAILYASVAEAVGLEPVVYLVPGHCFPAVLLPESHTVLPVETTMIGRAGFEDAVKAAGAKTREVGRSGLFFAVHIRKLQELGVDALELPSVPADYLDRIGYSARSRQPAPGQASPGAAGMEPGLFATIEIANPLQSEISFELQSDDGTWQAYTVAAGKNRTFWRNATANTQVRPILIRFLSKPGSAVPGDPNAERKVRRLDPTLVADPKKDWGTRHFFALISEGTELEIYRK
jgi:hypothetical protein